MIFRTLIKGALRYLKHNPLKMKLNQSVIFTITEPIEIEWMKHIIKIEIDENDIVISAKRKKNRKDKKHRFRPES